ncbi:MAG TPA: hypothetical protein VII23_20740 [Terriglobales bacterium]|jgi:hypothetical protein
MKPVAERAAINTTRTLICIPIIHTPADMGALSEPIQRLKVKKLGKRTWEQNIELVKNFWTEIEQATESLDLPYQRLRLYQDGLPVCGHEWEIVNDLAKAGSRNYQLLLKLKEKGATLMGTESSELLVEEYQLAKQVVGEEPSQDSTRHAARWQSLQDFLLKRRDQFIGRRISETLLAGETGLLFVGMLHAVEPWLDEDIQVIRPIRPALRAGDRTI